VYDTRSTLVPPKTIVRTQDPNLLTFCSPNVNLITVF
jgi:hypothetical protein